MDRKDIPTLTELINKANIMADDASNLESGDMISANALISIAYSQIAIARSLSHQTDIMVAVLKQLAAMTADVGGDVVLPALRIAGR